MSQAQLSADLLDECRNLALMVAPELTAAPLYPTNLPSGYPDCGDTLAFTITRGIDFAIRRHLLDEGRWQGPGTIIAFCQPMSRDEVLGLLLHEVAHAVPFKSPPADVEPTAETQSLQRQPSGEKHFPFFMLSSAATTVPTMSAKSKVKNVRN